MLDLNKLVLELDDEATLKLKHTLEEAARSIKFLKFPPQLKQSTKAHIGNPEYKRRALNTQ